MLRTFSQRSTFDGGAFCFAESLSIAIREEGGKSALRSAPGADTQSEPAKFALTDQQEEGSKVFSRIKLRFKSNPPLWYAMSIAATWAGAGSFIVGSQIANTYGIFPWLLWALGNTLTCIVFGLLAQRMPKLRNVAKSKPVQILMGLMCVFQIWVNMNGIYEMLAPTVIGSTVAYVIVYALSIFFIVFYLRQATFRNVATDNMSWLAVYALIALLVVYSMLTNGVHGISTEIDPVQIRAKGWLCVTLAFCAFFYPTFWELLDYKEQNEDGTKQISMTRPFIMGGLLFGFYLLFVLAGAFTTYSPAVDLLKGVLVALVAVSSLSSFLYGSMVNFGKKLGVIVDIAAVASWQLLVPMGVMGVWTLMQNVRIWMVLAMFAAALIWWIVDRRKAVTA